MVRLETIWEAPHRRLFAICVLRVICSKGLRSLFHFSVTPNFPELETVAHEPATQMDLIAHFPQHIPWSNVVLLKCQTFQWDAPFGAA